MQHLFVYSAQAPSLSIDINAPDRSAVIDAIYIVDKYEAKGIISNYRNPFNAHFGRRADTGEILAREVPTQLEGPELIDLLTQLKEKIDRKMQRKVNPRSLQNLRKRQAWTAETRPTKPVVMTELLVKRAVELRDKGCSWRTVGDVLGVHKETARGAVNRTKVTVPDYA